jgi:hypothetical protein
MDFDHVGIKTANISALMFTVSTGRLVQEIQFCEVVCSNCHRLRTHRRTSSRQEKQSGFLSA